MAKVCLLLATLHMLCLLGVSSELSDFVTKYERVRMHSFTVPATKGVDSMSVKQESQGGYRVSFEAYGQKFNLSLAEDPRHMNRIPVYVHNNSGVSRVSYDSDYTIYIGRLEDNPRSEVMGYFRDGIFDGVIRTESNVYFVEPADNFFLEKQNYDAVVYSGMEVMAPDCITMDGGVRACFQNKTHAYGPSKMLQRLPAEDVLTRMSAQRVKEFGKGSSLRVCGIELLADHSFYRSRNRNINLVVQEMILHLHYADLVFRNTDFNLPFRIGLIPEKVTIFTDPSTKGYPLGQEDLSAKDYLASFSFYVQRHCLVVGFSHRPFESNTLGISFVANPDPEGPVGGICELPMRFIDQDTIHSFNIASITTSTSNRKRVPHGVSFGTVTHEIGHSFGSPHDPAADPSCHPIGKSGFFIMVKYSVDGSLPNHRAFSPCSVRDMRKVVKDRWQHVQSQVFRLLQRAVRGDGALHRGTKKTCRRGKCQSTPCQDRGMLDCVCVDEGRYGNNECHICCRNGTHAACMPAIEHGLKSLDGRLFVQRSDYFCHGRRGQCDGFGICIVSPTISHSSTTSGGAANLVGTAPAVASFLTSLLILLLGTLARRIGPLS
ncbi:conserved hypothetical protein [Ixodes scapularis]|uniref:Peptidase M12B domain-containing protein n=1 Tax=Ixodes scapularis TaxID=6945 RepID=B7P5F4_IXOSC|nr:conserved hypothetical protein [Ixodes scapularis]|eukprot:XP_002407318.1 conserved hypothetical protein [Ixodes scapularis]